MSRDVRFDLDSGRYLDYQLPGTPPPPGWIEKMEADIAALPIAHFHSILRGAFCPACGDGPEIDEDGTFGVRSCDSCGQEVRAR